MKKKTAEQQKEEKPKRSIPKVEDLCFGESEIIYHALRFWGKREQRDGLRATLERRARNGKCLPEYMTGLIKFHFYVRKHVKDRWKNKAVPTANEFLDPDNGLWRKDPNDWMPGRIKEDAKPMVTSSIWDDEPTGDLI